MRAVSALLDDAAKVGLKDFPLMGAVYGKLFGMDDDAKYDLVTEAWVYASQTFNPDIAKWTTYYYNTAHMIRRKRWSKEHDRKHKAPPILAISDNPDYSDPIANLSAPADTSVEDEDATAALKARIMRALKLMPPRWAAIMIAHHGLDGREPIKLTEIARRTGVSRQGVEFLYNKAKRFLRETVSL